MWYILRDGKKFGPVTVAEFDLFVQSGHLQPTDYLWREGLVDWQSAAEFLKRQSHPQEVQLARDAPGHTRNQPDVKQRNQSARSTIVIWTIVFVVVALVAWSERHPLLYRLGAGVNGAVFGAIGGGLAGIFGYGVERIFKKSFPQNWKVGAVSVGVCLGFVVAKIGEAGIGAAISPVQEAAYERVVKPTIDRAYVVQALRNAGDAGRLYRAVEQKEPQTFEAIVEVLTSELRSSATQDEIISLMRQQFIERISKPRTGYLADNDMFQLFQLTVDTMTNLAASNPRLCVLMAQGKPFGDLRPYLKSDIAQREQAIMERLLDTKPRQIPLLPATQLQEINKKAFISLFKVHGNSVELLDPAKVFPGQEKATCLLYRDYFRIILALSQDEATAILRAMLLDPARLG